MGGIFFLGLTWIEQRALGRRWLLTGGLFLAALIVANFTRFLLLVVIGFVCGQPALARLVHLPLGVFGFVASCTLAVVLVRRLPEHCRDDLACADAPLRSGVFLLAGLLLFLGATGKETLSQPPNPLAFTSTPEPHEWVLIGLAVIAGLTALRQRRQTQPRQLAQT